MNFKRCVLASLAVTILAIGSANAQAVVSSSKCTATSVAGSAAGSSKNIGVVVIAKAFNKACGKYGPNYVKDIEKAVSPWASAFAVAVTKASATCVTKGQNAFGCAKATSSASAEANVVAAALAVAGAKAARGCGCIKRRKAVFVKEFGAAATYLNIIATARSSVSAAVCAKNGQAASASIYQVCLASAVTKVFAKALAIALRGTGCYAPNVYTKIKAVTGSKTYITAGCNKKSKTSGNGKAAVKASGGAAVNVQDLLKDAGLSL